MDDSLRLIQYLYGESVDDPDFPRRVAEDEALREEFDQLQETKSALDRRSPPTPSPDVVDRVVEHAAEAADPTRTDEHAADRPARAPNRAWTRRWQNAGAALALVAALGLGWWYMPGDGVSSGPATSETASQQAPSAATASSPPQAEESLPEWDDRDEVVRLHRRLELLQTQSQSDAWSGDLQTTSGTTP